MAKLGLWIDDERLPPTDGTAWVWAKTSAEAITALTEVLNDDHPGFDVISFDHDLGNFGNPEIPAYHPDNLDDTKPVMFWMIDNDIWASTIYVHSANPIGRRWLVTLAKDHAPRGTVIAEVTYTRRNPDDPNDWL